MNSPAKRLFAACLATMVAAAAPGITNAAENETVVQDLVRVRESDQVTIALWSRQSDAYTLQLMLDWSRYPGKANTVANPITTVAPEVGRRPEVINVAEALAELVPQNTGTHMPGLNCSDPALSRGASFICSTIVSLRGMDPSAPCGRKLTLVDNRRAAALPQSPPLPPATLNQPYPPKEKERRVEVWLLRADGTQILPAAYSCAAERGVDSEVGYHFSKADGEQAVAAAIRINDDYYIEKLQRLTPN